MNKYQKATFRPGEHRTRPDEIEDLLELSQRASADARCHAAENLCPCHVRRRVDEVWQALYRMMEDPDVRVRRAAWHTLEDGGCRITAGHGTTLYRTRAVRFLSLCSPLDDSHFQSDSHPWIELKCQRNLIIN